MLKMRNFGKSQKSQKTGCCATIAFDVWPETALQTIVMLSLIYIYFQSKHFFRAEISIRDKLRAECISSIFLANIVCARAHVDLEKPYGTQREFFQKWYAAVYEHVGAMSTTADCVHEMCSYETSGHFVVFAFVGPGGFCFDPTRKIKSG